VIAENLLKPSSGNIFTIITHKPTMNTSRVLIKRLLDLLPIQVVKDQYNLKGNAGDVIEKVSGSNTIDSLKNFVFENIRWTKQNIHLYTLNKKFNRSDISNFHYAVEKEVSLGTVYQICLLPEVTYSVYLSNPTSKQDIVFLLPVVLKIHNKSLIIHFTKLEKKISSYFGADREAKQASVIDDEDQVLRKVIDKFEQAYTVTKTDFNKGIKDLWENDLIDCQKIQWRKSDSIANEKMDGNLTFKQKYPQDYQQIIRKSLENTIWKYLLQDSLMCEKFSTNPSMGIISITQFPNDVNQVNNVITKILAGN
jgi:hypothetical protein